MTQTEENQPMTNTLTHLYADFETTGLHRTLDHIVEVGIIGVDSELNELFAINTLIRPTTATLERFELSPGAKKMAEVNGLYQELASHLDDPALPTLAEIEKHIIDLTSAFTSDEKFTLAGSGVANFDHEFIKMQMPKLLEHLTYWTSDVGDRRRSWRESTGGDLVAINKDKSHRAFDDVLIHLDEARAYRTVFAALTDFAGGSDLQSIMNALGAPVPELLTLR